MGGVRRRAPAVSPFYPSPFPLPSSSPPHELALRPFLPSSASSLRYREDIYVYRVLSRIIIPTKFSSSPLHRRWAISGRSRTGPSLVQRSRPDRARKHHNLHPLCTLASKHNFLRPSGARETSIDWSVPDRWGRSVAARSQELGLAEPSPVDPSTLCDDEF